MADGTKIEWTDATVNAVNGCSVISPGCKHCYAMKQAHRFPVRQGLTMKTAGGMVWTGEVRFNEKALLQPLGWTRPRRIFWNAHGDLFHESVPDEWIDRVFAVCALTPQHQHQILTKRSARMQAYVAAHRWQQIIDEQYEFQAGGLSTATPVGEAWPLPNVWLGVSVEDQQRADERIPDLLATPAAVRFLSCEPLLGPVDIRCWTPTCYECGATCGLRLPGMPDVERCTECGEECGPETEPVISEGCPKCSGELEPVCPNCGHYMVYQHPDTPYIDWVIVGGESGPGARPMHPDWARSLRDQCAAAAVQFFFKQWGEWLPWEPGCPPEWQSQSGHREDHHALFPTDIDADPRWDDGIWAVPEHDLFAFQRVGKKVAGRLLDGLEHSGMPA